MAEQALDERTVRDMREGAEFGRNAWGAGFSRDDTALACGLCGPVYQAAALAAFDEAVTEPAQ